MTGAARGIGAAIADALRADGMEVVTIDLAEGCDIRLDVARDPFPDLGDVDVCVPNAAITDDDRARAPHDAGAVAARHRREPDRRVPDRAGVPAPGCASAATGASWRSRAARRRAACPGQVAYGASKAGVIGMVKTIAAENVARGITANAVLPGFVETEQVRAMPAEVLERVTADAAGRAHGEPAEVAALVAYLASEHAGYVTGQAIGIDGGLRLNTRSIT